MSGGTTRFDVVPAGASAANGEPGPMNTGHAVWRSRKSCGHGSPLARGLFEIVRGKSTAQSRLPQAAGAARPHRALGLGRDAERSPIIIAHADHGVVVGRRGTRLECFENHPLVAGSGAHAGLGIDADELDA